MGMVYASFYLLSELPTILNSETYSAHKVLDKRCGPVFPFNFVDYRILRHICDCNLSAANAAHPTGTALGITTTIKQFDCSCNLEVYFRHGGFQRPK